MKYFEDLTEEEVIQSALKAVSTYREAIRGTGKFDLDECVEMELKQIELLFKHRRTNDVNPINLIWLLLHNRSTEAMNERRKAQEELEKVLAHYKPLLRERTLPIQQRYLRGRKVAEINAVAAKAIIDAKMQEVGLKATVTGQRYRVRITTPLGLSRRIRLYVNYKDIHKDERLNEIIAAMRQMQDAMDKLGSGAIIE